ncbi:uncharacterized protein LOC128276869 [Anopheles cruzii]|uniref:uncharacterized protein LOC128276869 n=1 Tax=Anopheles cruzii TaxID=68878 RepID=UPI0022EC6F7B|nr:uncharacterized protein LOC128276869 [Anopheles cruzii]
MLIDVDEYVQSIGRFLMGKSYKLVRSFDRNFIYQHISVASAAKQRQQQQQLQQLRQQHIALPDGASSTGNGGLVAPPPLLTILAPHGNAISSGEKVDLTMAIRKGQEGAGGSIKVPISLSPSVVKVLPTAVPTTTAPASASAVNSVLPSTTARSLSSKTGEKLVLLRGSETDDANDSEFFDAEFTSDNTNESEEELKQPPPPQQRQSFEDETREELDDGSVRAAANVLPPMVSTL